MFGSMMWAAATELPLITVTLAASENNPNMVSKFTAAGWDGSSAIRGKIVINPGVVIGSTSTLTAALDLTSASFHADTQWEIANNGRIEGKGGAPGAAGTASDRDGGVGGKGGPALKVDKPTRLTNASGQIWGGGGGGGGGGCGPEVTPIGGGSSGFGVGGSGGNDAGGEAGVGGSAGGEF